MNVEVVQCFEVVVCEQPVQTIVQDPCAVPVDKRGTGPTCGCGGGFGGAIAASNDDNSNAPIASPVVPLSYCFNLTVLGHRKVRWLFLISTMAVSRSEVGYFICNAKILLPAC